MPARRLVLSLAAWGGLLGTTLRPAEPAPAELAQPDPATPTRSGLLSARITAAVRERLPGYAGSTAGASEPEARPAPEGVIVLPRLVVRDRRARWPEPREWLTAKGRDELLRRKYPGAILGGAAALEREERRLEQLRELTELADAGATAAGRDKALELRREIDRAFARRPDVMTDPLGGGTRDGRR